MNKTKKGEHMIKNDIIEKFNMIMTKEELERIGFEEEDRMTVDLHGLSEKTKAIRFVRNIIALSRDPTRLLIRHGEDIGNTMITEIFNPRITESRRVNSGMTIITLGKKTEYYGYYKRPRKDGSDNDKKQ